MFAITIATLLCAITTIAQTDSLKPVNVNRLLMFPVVARSVETNWIFGTVACGTFRIDHHDSLSRTSNIQVLTLYSMKKQFVAAINGTIYFPNENYILNHRFSYSYFPDKYWGIGSHSKESSEESYKFKQYYVYMHLMKKVSKDFFLGVLYEQQRLLTMHYLPGGMFDKESIPGRKGYLVSGTGLSATLDNRNNAFSPDKGTYIQASARFFSSAIGSDFNYVNIVQDIRKYIPAKKGIFAFQLFNYMNIGRHIPLRSMAALGGDNIMRGYYNGRFRDRQQLVIQAEYRVPVYNRWGIVFFTSAGDVTGGLMNYSIGSLKYAYGSGIRFALNKAEKLNLRLDYGMTSTGNKGFYLQLGEAF